jgi:hypothetical protein
MVLQYPGKMSEFHCVIKAISGALGNLSRNCSMFLREIFYPKIPQKDVMALF